MLSLDEGIQFGKALRVLADGLDIIITGIPGHSDLMIADAIQQLHALLVLGKDMVKGSKYFPEKTSVAFEIYLIRPQRSGEQEQRDFSFSNAENKVGPKVIFDKEDHFRLQQFDPFLGIRPRIKRKVGNEIHMRLGLLGGSRFVA